MITSIQIHEDVKNQLDKMKQGKESYGDVIANLVMLANKQKRSQTKLLIEGCKEMTEESLKICKEFDSIEEDFDWEWK